MSKFQAIKQYLLKILDHLKNNLYLYLIPFPLAYLAIYYLYLDNQTLKSDKNLSFFFRPEVLEFLKQLSVIFFSGGIFTATVKLINNMVIFKKNFHKMILSEEFDNLLIDKFKILSLSDEYLLNRSDINDIWARVTSCRFAKSFPNLSEKIKFQLQNDFFDDKMLKYYYDNFRIQINIELIESDIIKITEISNFKLRATSKEQIDLEFKISAIEEDGGKIYTKLVTEECKVNGCEIEFTESSLIGNKSKVFALTLNGSQDYLVERKVEMTQDLKIDRAFSFSSSIIIDNILIDINTCEKLQYFFSPSNKNYFPLDPHNPNGTTYISRELLMPGEKFKMFIYKK
ncbi:MAG TPA: hypothetical protein DCW66_16850 [Sphingobacterium sp.]|uniref:hypothetical protein n=1 Tax=Sphingobacterium siyangense TaxID=459529 RepID=UPI000E9C27B9|nr:hypothetical protein [Sphingobacterium sp.]